MSDYTDNLSNMLCLDVYLSSLSRKEHQKISHKIKPLKFKPHPLLSADIYCAHAEALVVEAHKRYDLHALQHFQQKLHWQANLQQILAHDYCALVLTDASLTIQWVNRKFKNMTGYSARYAIGKTPKFLQGRNTSDEVRQRIRQQLTSAMPFTEILTNYRSNKEEYRCLVTIYPLLNVQQQITHFLALEKETGI